jgi:hypothetical protein
VYVRPSRRSPVVHEYALHGIGFSYEMTNFCVGLESDISSFLRKHMGVKIRTFRGLLSPSGALRR